MKKTTFPALLMFKLAQFTAAALCAVLFVCANTNSSCMIYQPEAPAGLERFRKHQ